MVLQEFPENGLLHMRILLNIPKGNPKNEG